MPLVDGIVYGPVLSRRLGRSLGVNVLPPGIKVCTMNCAYCQYGWTRLQQLASREARRAIRWPTPARIETAVASRLDRAAADEELLDRLTLAGHGEPTMHPQFEEIAERLCRLRDRLAPGLRLAILSNSTTAWRPRVRRGLSLFDERHMKLDAGDPITCGRLNGPGVSVRAIVDALRDLPRVTVQAMFVADTEGSIDNTTEGVVREWLDAVDAIQPARVDIYTIDRPPALGNLRRVPAERLREIAGRVRTMGIPADVYASSDDQGASPAALRAR